MTARVAAVVLAWNGREDTLACLRALQRATYPELSIVVVDNGSTDGGPEAVAAEFPAVRLLPLGENRGFAGGVNAGADAALGDGADAVLLLNNDATVEPGFLESLVDVACADGVGAACAQILDSATGRIWYAGASYDPRRGHQGRHTGYGDPPLSPATAPYETERACGGAMLIPRAALEEVGPLDETLFAYAEDVDWSLRARAAGVPLRLSDARATHAVGSSTSGAVHAYYSTRNRLWFLERERGRPVARREAVRTAARAAVRGMVAPGVARARLEGVADWARGRMGRRRYPR